MDNTRTRNWRQTHTSETEGLSFQPLLCPGPESVADTEMANSMWAERGRGGGGEGQEPPTLPPDRAQRDSVRAWGRWGEAGLQGLGQGARGRGWQGRAPSDRQ